MDKVKWALSWLLFYGTAKRVGALQGRYGVAVYSKRSSGGAWVITLRPILCESPFNHQRLPDGSITTTLAARKLGRRRFGLWVL